MASEKDKGDEKEVAKEEEKKQPEQKQVRIVVSRGKGAVVEWVEDGKAFRKIVPLSKMKGDKIGEDVLDKSPDYGVPWAKEIKLNASAEDLEIALHNAGVWTAEDAMKNPRAIIGAINTAYKNDLAAILKAAKKYIKKE
jgi:hypothetical protein